MGDHLGQVSLNKQKARGGKVSIGRNEDKKDGLSSAVWTERLEQSLKSLDCSGCEILGLGDSSRVIRKARHP